MYVIDITDNTCYYSNGMSNTVINVTQIRDNLAEVLGRVKFGEEVVTVEKKGKPYAVIMSPQ